MENFYTPREKFISVALIVFASIMLTLTSKVQSQLIVTVTNIDSVLCFNQPNGSITVSASGGTPPYNYLWSPGGFTTPTINNLMAGTYTVTVNDDVGSSASQSATVYQPSMISVSAIGNLSPCQDTCEGTATATASGGTPPYNYYWNNGQTGPVATGLCVGTSFITVTDAAGCSVVAGVIINQPPQPATLYLNAVDVWCYGDSTGAVELNYADIQPTDTYMWSNGDTTQDINNLPAGIYCVTVTTIDSCVRTACITVTQPASAVCVTVVTLQNLVCWNVCEGIAYAIPCGGTPGLGGYTLFWDTLGCTNDSLIDVCAGTYTVTVMDGAGCIVTGTAIITQPPQPAPLILTAVDVLCYGDITGQVELNYADIQPTDTYLWSNGETSQDIESLPAGLYCVTVTKVDGCNRVACITVNQPADPLSSSTNITNAQCYNDCNGIIDLTVNGGTPGYTYFWSPQIGGINITSQDLDSLCVGTDSLTYNVIITDANGCIAYDTATIFQPQTVLIDTISSFNASCQICNDGTATVNVTGGITPYSYSWNTSPAQFSSTAINLLPGIYIVTITDAYGCSLIDSVLVSFNNNINEVINSSLINVYPNPADENIEIKTELQITNIEITDITGRLLYITTSKTLPSRQAGIDCSSFAKGVYFIRMETEKGITVMKFVKG